MFHGLRICVLAGVAHLGMPAALADTYAPEGCPAGAVSIYFASGDSAASPQARAVLVKVGETAGECRPDRIDLVAHLDASEGDRALELALARLTIISDELVSAGLSAAQIRIAASRDQDGDISSRHVDIRFLKRDAHGRMGGDSQPAAEPTGSPSDI